MLTQGRVCVLNLELCNSYSRLWNTEVCLTQPQKEPPNVVTCECNSSHLILDLHKVLLIPAGWLDLCLTNKKPSSYSCLAPDSPKVPVPPPFTGNQDAWNGCGHMKITGIYLISTLYFSFLVSSENTKTAGALKAEDRYSHSTKHP